MKTQSVNSIPLALSSAWETLASCTEASVINELDFLNAGRDFRYALNQHLIDCNMAGASRAEIITLIEQISNNRKIEFTETKIKQFNELLGAMVDYGKSQDQYFGGSSNEISQIYNTTLSTLHVVIHSGEAALTDGMSRDDIKQFRARTGPSDAPSQNTVAQFYHQESGKYSCEVLRVISQIVSEEPFWSARSKTGITGISKIRALLKDRDIDTLTGPEAVAIFQEIIAVAEERESSRKNAGNVRKFFNAIFSPRDKDTTAFYRAIIQADFSNDCTTSGLSALKDVMANKDLNATVNPGS